MLDSNGVIVAVNEGWRKFARDNGYDGDRFGIGVSYLDACRDPGPAATHFAEEAERVLRAVLGGGAEAGSFDYPCHSPSQRRWFRMTVLGLRPPAKGGAVVLHLDVTRECEDRALQENALRRMHLAGGAKKSIAGLIHDVKTPLHAIAGMVDFLRHDLAGPTTPKQQDYFQHIARACEQAAAMIDQEATRLYGLDETPAEPVTDVVATLREIVELVETDAVRAGIMLEARLPDGLPLLAIPAAVLARIVGNLVGNAIRYAGAGARLRVAAALSDAGLTITVADDGVGVARDDLDRLVEPGHRGHDVKASGAGIGLTVVRTLATTHGATLAIDSAPGAGVRVDVLFPRERLVARDAPGQPSDSRSPTATRPPEAIRA